MTESIILAIGIAAAGYFIGDGLKNFKNPSSENVLDSLGLSDDDDHELIKEKNLHYFVGISKEDVKILIKEYPDIPHITLNGNNYFPRKKLKEWLKGFENE